MANQVACPYCAAHQLENVLTQEEGRPGWSCPASHWFADLSAVVELGSGGAAPVVSTGSAVVEESAPVGVSTVQDLESPDDPAPVDSPVLAAAVMAAPVVEASTLAAPVLVANPLAAVPRLGPVLAGGDLVVVLAIPERYAALVLAEAENFMGSGKPAGQYIQEQFAAGWDAGLFC